MMDEHKFAWEIVSDLNAIWGDDEQRKTWAVLGEGNPYESQRRTIVMERLEEYRTTLAASTPASLRLKAKLRADELGQLYQQSAEHRPTLGEKYQENMIRTLRDLTIGYAAASVIAYNQQGVPLQLPESICAEVDALAASAVAQGLTDADTFRGILNTSTRGGRSQGDYQPSKKEYNLLSDHPNVTHFFDRLVPKYLNEDYSLKEETTDADASVIADVIATEVGTNTGFRYFESFWGMEKDTLKNAKAGVIKRKNHGKTESLLRLLLGDEFKVNRFLRQYYG